MVDNKIKGNAYSDAIKIEGENISRSVLWQKGDYHVQSLDISDKAQLTVEAGSVVKATEGAVISGKIIAEGKDSEPVVFTCLGDSLYGGYSGGKAAGRSWKGLRLKEGSRLRNCKINYASFGDMGIWREDEDVVIIKVESNFIDKGIGLFKLSKLSEEATGQKKTKKEIFKNVSVEILTILAIIIPLLLLFVAITAFKGGRQ